MKILLVNVCKEKLHYYEFVKPIGDILKSVEIDFFVRHYLDLKESDLELADKVIICGTSLKDDFYFENFKKFNWLKDFDKPVLGICAGMQIMGLIFGGKSEKKKEVGFYFENFKKDFLNFKKGEKIEVYHLHRNYVVFDNSIFEFAAGKEVAQAIKHKDKPFFGVLFHPEVRNKKMVLEFANG